MDVRVVVTKTKIVETTYLVQNVETLNEAGELALSYATGYPRGNVAKVDQTTPAPINEVSTYEVIMY